MKKYNIIYADPPWSYKGGRGDATKHYPTMSQNQIKSLPVGSIADDNCALFLWATWPQLKVAMEVIEEWGFEYKTNAFLWVKINKSGWAGPAIVPGKSDFMGMGYYTRGNSEFCLLAMKGHLYPVNRGIRQTVFANRRAHSQKPRCVRNKIVDLFGDIPRIELFARETIGGWDSWGNEVEGEIPW